VFWEYRFKRNTEKKEIIDYLNKYTWFTNWSNKISIESLLNKKELKIGYEK
jgi:UDP-galactopyranose mutase